MEPIHRLIKGQQGYVCAQVNPSLAGDREAMYAMAKRFNAWAPNIAIKLPATAAGLDVMEKICSEGMAATITVSFSVPQVYVTGRRYQKLVKERKAGSKIGKCFAVIMIGRLDDYLREVFADNREAITEQEVRVAGLKDRQSGSERCEEELKRRPEFMKAYDPKGLSEKDLITFGPTQRTLSQFIKTGWKLLEQFQL